jgi:hypothetical protein
MKMRRRRLIDALAIKNPSSRSFNRVPMASGKNGFGKKTADAFAGTDADVASALLWPREANAFPDNRPVARGPRREVVRYDHQAPVSRSPFAGRTPLIARGASEACALLAKRARLQYRPCCAPVVFEDRLRHRRQISLDPDCRMNRLSGGLFLVLSHIWISSIDRNDSEWRGN